MKNVRVYLEGCDDITTFEIEVTEAQYVFLTTLVMLSNDASEYGCQPAMKVRVLDD